MEKLHRNGIRLRVVGDLAPLRRAIAELIERAEQLTAANRRLTLTIAANYGGRWDILQAFNAWRVQHPERAAASPRASWRRYLAMSYAPEPDLFIRTGGEQRISNFLLWQLAYTELYFTDTLWPDFDAARSTRRSPRTRERERRFGRTSEQLVAEPTASCQRRSALPTCPTARPQLA